LKIFGELPSFYLSISVITSRTHLIGMSCAYALRVCIDFSMFIFWSQNVLLLFGKRRGLKTATASFHLHFQSGYIEKIVIWEKRDFIKIGSRIFCKEPRKMDIFLEI
jgi:hypothetical protein